MKKYFIALAAIVFAAVACNKEVDNVQPIQKAKRHITVLTQTPETRTVLDDEHNALVWAPGDNFRLMTNTADEEANHDAATLQYAEGGLFEAEVSEDATEAYAYYFAGTYTDVNHSTPTAYTAYVNYNQTQTKAGVLNGQMIPMAAKGTINDDNTVSLEFHQMAGVLALNIYSTEKVEGEVINAVKVTPTANTKFCGALYNTDLTADDVVYTEGSSDKYTTVTVELGEAYDYASAKPADKKMFDSQIYVALAKQAYSAVKFEIVTNKGTYEITSSGAALDLTTNDFYPVNINLAKAEFVGTETLSGTYAILAEKDGVYYAMANTHKDNGSRLDEVEFESIPSYVTDKALVWTLAEQSDGTYAITDADGKYLTASTGNDANVGTTAKYCTILAEDEAYNIKQNGRYLSRNNTSLGFAFYGNTSQNYALYLVPIEYKALPSFVWGEESTVIDADDESEHTITLTISDFTSVSSVKVFEEDETTAVSWLVASYADGKVSFMAEENTGALRKAVIVVTAVNEVGSASSKITITQKKAASGGETHPYSFTITTADFNSTSYSANNNAKTTTATATDDSGKTMDVEWTSNQVMLNSGVMQWQKNTGYIYNNTDLGTITSITIESESGSFTTYYGDVEQPSESTVVGGPYFQIKVGNATGKTTKITINFEA